MEKLVFKNFKELRAFLKEGRTFVEPERVGVVEPVPDFMPKPIEPIEEEVKDEVPAKRSRGRRTKRNVSEDSNE